MIGVVAKQSGVQDSGKAVDELKRSGPVSWKTPARCCISALVCFSALWEQLVLQLGDIRHFQEQRLQACQQRQAVVAYVLIVGHDHDLVEESVDGRTKLG